MEKLETAPKGFAAAVRFLAGRTIPQAAIDASWRFFVIPTMPKDDGELESLARDPRVSNEALGIRIRNNLAR